MSNYTSLNHQYLRKVGTGWKLWGLAVLLLVMAAPKLLAGRLVISVTPRDVEYVLDADAGTGRDYHLLKGTATVRYSGPLTARSTRLVLSLIDDTGKTVPLAAGTNLTSTFNPGALGESQLVVHSFDFALDPDQQLDPERRYHVHAQAQQYVQNNPPMLGFWIDDLTVNRDSAERQYFHFTNTADSDPDYNLLGVVDSVSLDRTWRIQTLTDDSKNFQATCKLKLRRYDELAGPPSSANISFQLRMVLVDDLGATVALVDPVSGTESFSVSMGTKTSRTSLPYAAERSINVAFQPGVQLDPVHRTYRLEAQLWAPATAKGAPAEISVNSSPAAHLLDYNGNLRFGSGTAAVTTVMTDAARTAGLALLLPSFSPTYVSAGLDIRELTLSAGEADFTGSPGVISARLLSSGLATYSGLSPLTLSNPAGNGTQTINYQGVAFQLGSPLSLTDSGATGNIYISPLPAGMGVSLNNTFPSPNIPLSSSLSPQTNVALNASLAPADVLSWEYPSGRWVMEESKPVAVRVTAINWQADLGRFDLVTSSEVYHPESAMRDALSRAPAGLPDGEKQSNNDYWLLAEGVAPSTSTFIRQSPLNPLIGSNAALNVEFDLGEGSFWSHFPEAHIFVHDDSNTIRIEDDLLVPAESHLGSAQVYVPYLAGDPDASPTACGGAATRTRTFALQPNTPSARLNFTPTGGLRAPCESIVGGGLPLKWGFLGGIQYAFATDPFQAFTFYMPGTFYPQSVLGEGDSDLGHQYTPVAIHTCGNLDGLWRFGDMESSGTSQYRTNSRRADYAGINARVADEPAGFQGHSIISGRDAGSYPLKPECRYYARKSGVTGIHDAFRGPTDAILYGFQASFSSYGFAFRDCRVTSSVTDGRLVVPQPSDFEVELENIRFSSTGRPLNARLPSNIAPLNLGYWNCKMQPSALAFSSTDPCDAKAGLLRIQAGVEMLNLGQTLYGELGFRDDGKIATASDGVAGLTSRLKAPNHVTIRGPEKPGGHEKYTLTPVTDVYLNNYDDDPAGQGFLNLAGKLDVAFFEDLQVHLQTTAGLPGQEGTAPLFITGGWIDEDDDTFFSNPTGFDSGNRGFPAGDTLSNYRTSADYRPSAQRTWMDSISFDYPLEWDNATRSFRSPDGFEQTVNLMVLDAHHNLDYLSAEKAELSFGANYSGLPQINLGNMLVNAIDESTGVLSAVESAMENAVGGVLLAGSDAMAGLLNDNFDELFGPVLETALAPSVEAQILTPLATGPDGPRPEGSLRPSSEWEEILRVSLTNPTVWLQPEMTKLGTQVQGQTVPTYVSEMSDAIGDALDALDVFIGPNDGLLAVDAQGNYKFASKLIFNLIDMVASEEIKTLLGIKSGGANEAWINQQTTRYVSQYAPSLNTIRARLERLKAQLLEVQTRLDNDGNLAKFIQEKFTSAAGKAELGQLGEILVDDIIAHLEAQYGGSPEAFITPANRDATSAFIIRRIRDRVAAGGIAMGIQTLLRQQLQDLQAAIDQTVGSLFSNFNRIIRDLVAEAAGSLDEAVEELNGELASMAGAGSIDGYAVIRGDRLDSLRLDAELELQLDEPMNFKGFLEINQLQTSGPYGDAREIILGATDVPIELLDSSANFDIIGRIILDADSFPVSLGGSIEMTGGQLEFESFKITNLAASMMFGASDNYLAAKLGMEFESYRVMGGLFIGHSNSLEPLILIDPEVASLITGPSITGIYAYGEVFMPIVDLSCMFRVSAGLGIGMFYFTEGPTYGGKILAAVEGEALCAVTVSGEVVLIGVKSDIMRFKGTGKVSGKVGWCPFCVRFNKSVGFTYDENTGFDADY